MSSSQISSSIAASPVLEVKARSDNIAIRVNELSKCFEVYETPRDQLKQFLLPRLQRLAGQSPKQYFREFWALKNVSFDIQRGETVGIVGRNGSGKSTLLQIICGTLAPTSGSVETYGRIAALLELGSGFNPEFTGRENVYMNAAVLGLSREEVDARFDDIAAFADIGEFIEQPVKTYSSGMQVRLAFAVAISVDPDILVVDEALSVGDELFQRKCFSRIEAIRKNGATILFVSHSGATVVDLCDRAILMDGGEKLMYGSPKEIVRNYQKLLYAPIDKRNEIRKQLCLVEMHKVQLSHREENFAAGAHETALAVRCDVRESFDPNLKPQSTINYESCGANIKTPQVLTLSGEPVNHVIAGTIYRFVYTVEFERSASNVRFGMMVRTTTGIDLGGTVSAQSVGNSIPFLSEGAQIGVDIQFRCALNPGLYFINAGVLGLVGDTEMYLHRLVDAYVFRVVAKDNNLATGIVDFDCVSTLVLDEKNEDR